jgi:predicted outer membrane protein
MALRRWVGCLAIVAAAGAVAACGNEHGSAKSSASSSAAGDAAPERAAPESTSTSSAARALVTVDQFDVAEIQTGALARRRAHRDAVRQLATTLVEDHSTMRADVHTLAQRLGILDALADSALTAESKAQIDTLRGLPAASFDRAYLAHELAAHQRFDAWLNQATSHDGDSELQRALARMRPQVVAHIARIRQAQAALGKS